ncbi:putative RNA polymerase II subunit B1 CTD phosphatase Rpap2 isoform X2 [Amphibalanus amphitrite]|uniref:putative RNA polymerase II subunit B1 CTD phosphatase Rpap2 isoform X2 n=1 Tax=Amphibalanus amphitrite TaxID=1232801 RepID=UPI001C91E45C|nr:putative RNA polymerase II subunit B1 CTD phosphatase Rpap2 isoform X2 [Amphibalanus amphitrite]
MFRDHVPSPTLWTQIRHFTGHKGLVAHGAEFQVNFCILGSIMEAHQLPKLTKRQKDILAAAEKKRFCDQRALHIVELLIEPVINPVWLLHQLQFIDQQHYDDVIEERSCTGCCGYPLCANRLGRVAEHQFHISTITNRIYDMSERKKYCSNACFRASRHLKPQIQTSPLWLRDKEPPPVFRLLQKENNEKGVAGDVVELGVARAPADESPPSEITTNEVATSMMHQFDELSEQIRDLGLKPEEERGKPEERGARKQRRSCLRRPSGAESEGGRAERKAVQFEESAKAEGSEGDEIERVCRVQANNNSADERRDDKPMKEEEPKKCVSEEVTCPQKMENDDRADRATSLDEASCRQDPADNPSVLPSAPEQTARSTPAPPTPPAVPAVSQTSGFKRPVRAARRQQHPLKVVEARLLDWLSDRTPVAAAAPLADPLRVNIPSAAAEGSTGYESPSGGTPDTPVPLAPVLSPEEAAARNRALLAYLQGQVRVPAAVPPRPVAPAQVTEDGRPVPPEPLLESQDKQRRRIVNDHLGKATARLLPPLGLLMSDVTLPLRLLVASFRLTATNVTMTPSQWTLAAVVLLNCLLQLHPDLAALARDADVAFSRALQPFQTTPASLDRLTGRLMELLGERYSDSGAAKGPESREVKKADAAAETTRGTEGGEKAGKETGVNVGTETGIEATEPGAETGAESGSPVALTRTRTSD